MVHKKYMLGLLLTISLLAWVSLSATGQISGNIDSSPDISSVSSHDSAGASSGLDVDAEAAMPAVAGHAPGWQDFGLLKAVYR